jgi:ElaB/YqjD/DUF883 family membrane-anchored ribosome-binding protein
VDQSVTIKGPVEKVYSFWHLENLPRFMRNVKSVKVKDNLHSSWVVKAPDGKTVTWDAEIIEQRENEMISWRSVPGSELENAGSVWFTPVPGGQATIVRVELKYIPPGGKTGELAARLFGRGAGSQLADDLRRLKALLEIGQLPDEAGVRARWQRWAVDSTRNAARATDDYVRESPWIFLACAAAAGLVLGLLLARSRSDSAKEMAPGENHSPC